MNKTVSIIIVVVIGLLMMRHAANADYLVQGAKITGIANTSSNADAFAVIVSGGTGPCANGWIYFPLSAFVSQGTMNRAIALAILAQTNGYSVSIYNYVDSACNNASYILTSNP